jgi:N-hydroxyarylamine O-acetyltransferase
MNRFPADYANRIGFDGTPAPTAGCLRRLHSAHLYTVPFENFSMRGNAERGLAEDVCRTAIVENRRGGICHETGLLMQVFLDACGFDHELRLGSVAGPNRTPATHQVFVVTLDGERWLFDIGYGAMGPRGPVPLEDGAELAHPALTTRVELDSGAPVRRWRVSVREHAVGATGWKPIYSFVDAPVGPIDLDMAHFYTVHSPNSPLTRHKVASIPTPAGRVSVRDDQLTIVGDGTSRTTRITDRAQLRDLLGTHFGLVVPEPDLGLEGQPCAI